MKKLIGILIGIIGTLVLITTAFADTPGGSTVIQGGTGNTAYPAYRMMMTGTGSTLRMASATSTLYLNNQLEWITATGSDNYFFGATPTSTTASSGSIDNFVWGTSAGVSMNAAAAENILLGAGSGRFISSGFDNTCLGDQSCLSLDTGFRNIGIGFQALENATSSNNAIAIGRQAMSGLLSGSNNIGIGFQANNINSTSSRSTAVGDFACLLQTAGDNTCLGYNAGASDTGHGSNIFVGSGADTDGGDYTNLTVIGKGAVGGRSNALILGGTGGNAVNVGIGTKNPANALTVVGSASISGALKDSVGSAGTSGQVLQASGSNTFSWQDVSSVVLPGTGLSYSGTTLNSVWTTNVNDIYNNNSGNVGIGTSSPFASLSVNSIAGIPGFVVGSSTGTSFIVDKNGKVGVGTVSPGYPLDIKTKAANNEFIGTHITETGNGSNILIGMLNASDSSFSLPGIWLNASTAIVPSFTNYAFLQDGSRTIFNTPSNNDIAFRVGNATYMTLSGQTSTLGNIGIGITAPPDPLVVVGANDSTSILTLTNDTGGVTDFKFARNASTGALSIQGNQVGFNNIILAPTSGSVGIGTTSPFSTLSVTGVLGTTPFTIASSTQTRLLQIDAAGHLIAGGNTYNLGAGCGSAPTNSGTDVAGVVTMGSGVVTSCAVKFGTAYSATPVVVVSDNSTAITIDVSAVSTTGFTISSSATMNGVVVYFHVIQPAL